MPGLVGDLRVRMRSSAVACSAAPIATASSGLMSVRGARAKNFETWSRTYGIFVVPPTRMTSLMPVMSRFASVSASWQTGNVRSMMSATWRTNSSRVISICRSSGLPFAPYAISSMRTTARDRRVSSIFVCSATARRRIIETSLLRRSMRFSSKNFSTMRSTRRSSRSSPPRNVSPEVPSTS